jgi:hypothetical protein
MTPQNGTVESCFEGPSEYKFLIHAMYAYEISHKTAIITVRIEVKEQIFDLYYIQY